MQIGASRRAGARCVVLPQPGGPQRIIEAMRPRRDHPPDRPVGAEQMVLADHLVERCAGGAGRPAAAAPALRTDSVRPPSRPSPLRSMVERLNAVAARRTVMLPVAARRCRVILHQACDVSSLAPLTSSSMSPGRKPTRRAGLPRVDLDHDDARPQPSSPSSSASAGDRLATVRPGQRMAALERRRVARRVLRRRRSARPARGRAACRCAVTVSVAVSPTGKVAKRKRSALGSSTARPLTAMTTSPTFEPGLVARAVRDRCLLTMTPPGCVEAEALRRVPRSRPGRWRRARGARRAPPLSAARDDGRDHVGRDGEADADRAAGAREDRGVDADEPAVERRPARRPNCRD